jgi:chromosome segregation ATPase
MSAMKVGKSSAMNSPVFRGKNLWTNIAGNNNIKSDIQTQQELEKTKEQLDQKRKEATSLRHRLVRRGYLLDTIRKSYLRDVVTVAEELRRKKCQGSDYEPNPSLDVMPGLDLKECIMLFDPDETALNIIPCDSCGGTVELIHLETKKIAELQKRIERLEKSETELKAEVNNYKALLLREQDRVTKEQQLAKEEQGYFLKEIGKLKHQIQEDDAPGLRAQLRDLDKTRNKLAEAMIQLRELDRTKYLLVDAKEEIGSLKAEVATQKDTIDKSNSTIKSLESDNRDLKGNVKKCEEQIGEMKKMIGEMKIEYKKMKKEVKKAEKDVERKQQALEKARLAEAKAKEECMQIKAECDEKVEDLEREIEVMQEKVDIMRAQEAEWKRKVKTLETKVKQAEEALIKEKEMYEKKRLEDAEKAKKERERKKREKAKFADSADDFEMSDLSASVPPPAAEEEITKTIVKTVIVTETVTETLVIPPPSEEDMKAVDQSMGSPAPMVAPSIADGGAAAALAQENARLKKELAGMDRKCKELVGRMQQIHSKYKASQEENAELESALEDSEKRVEAYKKEVDVQRGKVRAIEDVLSKLEEKINMLEDEKFMLMRRAKNAGEGSKGLQERLDAETKLRRKLERDNALMEKEIKITGRLRNGLQNLVTRQCMGMVSMSAETPGEKEVKEKCKQIKESEKGGALKLEIWQKLVRDSEKVFHDNINAQNKALSDANGQIADLKEQLQKNLRKMAMLQNTINEITVEKGKIRLAKEELEALLKKLRREWKEAEDKYNSKIRSLDRELQEREAECDDLRAKLKKATDTLKKTIADRNSLAHKLAAITRNLKDAEQREAKQGLELGEIVAKLEDTEKRLLATEEELAKMIAERNALAAQLQKLFDDEAAKIAARREKSVQVVLKPTVRDFNGQTNFVAPPATLRQHNATACHPAYFPGKSTVMCRPQAFPLPSSLSEVAQAGVQTSLPLGMSESARPSALSRSAAGGVGALFKHIGKATARSNASLTPLKSSASANSFSTASFASRSGDRRWE